MKRPALVILAAGIGSRYGGLKQIDPVGANGELIIDYSIYDALAAGFRKIVFIIKREIEEDFREVVGGRIARRAETAYAYQEIDLLPPGYEIPPGRVKPWGTAHALLAARNVLDGPFAVINADDYYGKAAFSSIFAWLSAPAPADGLNHYAMVGYRIENTVSEYGSVTRGVCGTGGGGFLTSVTERTNIQKTARGARFSPDQGATWTDIPAGTLVSMNFWGLDASFLAAAERQFPVFLDENLPQNPLKCEFLLPTEIDRLLRGKQADVKVLESPDVWHGVTYKEDRAGVVKAIAGLHEAGAYPTPLWD